MAMVFYHGTTTSRLEAIIQEGLQPRPSQDNLDRSAIYLTDDECKADEYSVLACDRRGGKAIVLEIDASQISADALEPDDYDLVGMLIDIHGAESEYNNVEPSCCDVDERLRPYKRWQDVPAELSLATTNQVAYTKAIPPSAIINLNELAREHGLIDAYPAMSLGM